MRRVVSRCLALVIFVLVSAVGVGTTRSATIDPDVVLGGARSWPAGFTSCAEVSLAGQGFAQPGTDGNIVSIGLTANTSPLTSFDVDISDAPALLVATGCTSLVPDFDCAVFDQGGFVSVSLSTRSSATIPAQPTEQTIAELLYAVADDAPPTTVALAIETVSANSDKGPVCAEGGSEFFFEITRCSDGSPDADGDGDGAWDCVDGCPDDPAKTEPGICGCDVPDTDSDADGTPDCIDGCPDDPAKTAPGLCGCGVPETDTDGDLTPDCIDECPDDPAKTEPGFCGCGLPETDADGDGTPDCVDGCPDDPDKTAPGACGCGVPETDTDGDGTPDCVDGCPDDPDKTAPGLCGCGVPETDTDADGTPDCVDGCPDDPDKTAPGICGCGVADTDTDGDLTPDCNDGCPTDPERTEPGLCGCNAPEVEGDTDGDGVPDCIDGCPDDPDKTAPGICGCGVADTDTDGDLTPDCNDQCPTDPARTEPGLCGCNAPAGEGDTDGDGVPDCIDGCPEDPAKTEPGICGCGVADDDTDGDLTPDCNDGCPEDPSRTEPGLCGCNAPEGEGDTDGDGVADCADGCPTDPTKTEPGLCGCNVPDDTTDTDGDLTPDCNDECPTDPSRTEPGLCGCSDAAVEVDADGSTEAVRAISRWAATLAADSVLDDVPLWPAGFTPCSVGIVVGSGSGAPGSEGNSVHLGLAFNNVPLNFLHVDIVDVPDLLTMTGCTSLVPDFDCTVDMKGGGAAITLMSPSPSATIPVHTVTTPVATLLYAVVPDAPLGAIALIPTKVQAFDVNNSFCASSVGQGTFFVVPPEVDTDGDGVPDCIDGCPIDPTKTEPGLCGCNVPDDKTDTDGDGIADCIDPCPEDPQGDADGDALCAGVDNCPDVANAEQADFDDDGVGDACDNCPEAPSTNQGDADGDEVGDVCDNCPDVPNGSAGLVALLTEFGESHAQITALVPNLFLFSGGETGTSIADGGNDMYDGGNVLNTNLAVGIPYTNGTIVAADGKFGPASRYFTAKYPGLFVMAATNISIESFFINGDNGADVNGTADAAVLTVPGGQHTVFVKRVHGGFDPSINHIIGVPGDASGVTQSFAPNTNSDLQTVSGLGGVRAIYYLLVARQSGGFLSNEEIVAIAESFTSNLGQVDSDLDGLGDACDPCPFDANNEDTDGDGTPDCIDGCPTDPTKTEPGLCGCNVPDDKTDTDGDGTPNCVDGCPDDPAKTEPGACGCGVPETDSDGDGTPDCVDGCPDDPSKTEPGDCGCGVPETDTDGDGAPDCIDPCPADPQDDADDDGVCGDVDNCPTIPNPGQDNADGDSLGDVCDPCPNDPLNDADDDGICADADNCPIVANPDQADSDGDGEGDACEYDDDGGTCEEASRSGWSVTFADSVELSGEDGAAANAIDGDPLTHWVTQWIPVSPNHPHEIRIDTGSLRMLCGFTYLPRQDGGVNGTIRDYEFAVSVDGANWNVVSSGVLFTDTSSLVEQQVDFEPTPGRHIRLRSLSEVNGRPWALVAELGLHELSPGGSQPPLPAIDAPEEDASVDPGLFLVFEGSAIDPDGDLPLSFWWGFPDCAIPSASFVEDPGPVVFACQPGPHPVTLTVCDDAGACATAERTVTVVGSFCGEMSRTGWSVTYVDSEELFAENGAGTNAIDGNELTNWVTEWFPESPSHPHEIVIDTGEVRTLCGFSYLPRQDGGVNGTIREYAFAVSVDGKNWTTVSSGVLFTDASSLVELQIDFAPTPGRHVRLRSLGEFDNGPWAVVAELGVSGFATSESRPPTATIDAPAIDVSIDPGDAVTFEGTGGDADGELPLTYLWSFPACAVPSSALLEDPGPVVFACPAGAYTVSCTVCDAANLCESAERTVNVIAPPCTLLPGDAWSVTYVDSEELVAEDGRAINAIDGDPSTIWVTQWVPVSPPVPHEIRIDLGSTETLCGFTYLQRQDGGINGTIREYELAVSDDGTSWTTVSQGILIPDQLQVDFSPTSGRHVRLRALSEINGGPWTTAAEIGFLAE